MTEAELAAIETRATPATACRNCGAGLDVDPAEDEAACPTHGYCWHCMTRGRHGRECRQSCLDVPALVAEVRRLRAALMEIRNLWLVKPEGTYWMCRACWHECKEGEDADLMSHDLDEVCGIAQAALAGPPSAETGPDGDTTGVRAQ